MPRQCPSIQIPGTPRAGCAAVLESLSSCRTIASPADHVLRMGGASRKSWAEVIRFGRSSEMPPQQIRQVIGLAAAYPTLRGVLGEWQERVGVWVRLG
jgi:hypothetical protein